MTDDAASGGSVTRREPASLQGRALAAALDLASVRAVPAARTDRVGGWIVRSNPGLATRRVNSVLPAAPPPDGDLARAIGICEQIYVSAGLTPCFQITPAVEPPDLEATLRAHGYVEDPPGAAVLTAPLSGRGPGSERDSGSGSGPGGTLAWSPGISSVIHAQVTDGWLSTWQEAQGATAERVARAGALLARSPLPTGFVTVSLDGRPAAVAMAAIDDPWAGIFNMATIPSLRRRGAGAAALGALCDWAAARGATAAYLQVAHGNTTAYRLYERCGFTHAYDYRYLAAPAGSAGSAG